MRIGLARRTERMDNIMCSKYGPWDNNPLPRVQSRLIPPARLGLRHLPSSTRQAQVET